MRRLLVNTGEDNCQVSGTVAYDPAPVSIGSFLAHIPRLGLGLVLTGYMPGRREEDMIQEAIDRYNHHMANNMLAAASYCSPPEQMLFTTRSLLISLLAPRVHVHPLKGVFAHVQGSLMRSTHGKAK